MAAPFHKILSKTDRALVAYIISEGGGTTGNTFPAKRSTDKSFPIIIVYSESWQAAEGNPGSCRVKSSIIIKSAGHLEASETDEHKPRKDSDDLAAAAFDPFYNYSTTTDSTELADKITAAARAKAVSDATNNADLADFKCDEARVVGGGSEANEEGHWIDALDLELIVRPSTDTEP